MEDGGEYPSSVPATVDYRASDGHGPKPPGSQIGSVVHSSVFDGSFDISWRYHLFQWIFRAIGSVSSYLSLLVLAVEKWSTEVWITPWHGSRMKMWLWILVVAVKRFYIKGSVDPKWPKRLFLLSESTVAFLKPRTWYVIRLTNTTQSSVGVLVMRQVLVRQLNSGFLKRSVTLKAYQTQKLCTVDYLFFFFYWKSKSQSFYCSNKWEVTTSSTWTGAEVKAGATSPFLKLKTAWIGMFSLMEKSSYETF